MVPGTTSYDPGTRMMTFRPTGDYELGREHTVTLVAGLRDLEGNSRTQDYVFHFETEPPTFTPDAPVEFTNDDSRLRVSKVNRDGHGVLLYLRDEGDGTETLRARNIRPGAEMDAEIELHRGISLAVHHERGLQVNNAGDAVIVWREEIGDDEAVGMRYYDSELGAWHDMRTVEHLADFSARVPQVVLDSFGTALIAWQRRDSNFDRVVRSVRYTRAQSFMNLVTVSGSPAKMARLHLKGSKTGWAIAAWGQDDENGVENATASIFSPVTRTWSFPVTVDLYSADEAVQPHAAIDDQGYAIVTWEQRIPGVPDDTTLWGRQYRPGLGFQDPVLLDLPAFEYRNVKTHIDFRGVGHLVYESARSNNPGVFVQEWDRTGWGSRTKLSNGTPVDLQKTQAYIKEASDGSLAVAWSQNGRPGFGGHWVVVSAKKFGDDWSEPKYVGETNEINVKLSHAARSIGEVLVVWEESSDGMGGAPEVVHGRSIRSDGSLEDPIEISRSVPGALVDDLVVLLPRSGPGLVVWTQKVGTVADVLFSRYGGTL